MNTIQEAFLVFRSDMLNNIVDKDNIKWFVLCREIEEIRVEESTFCTVLPEIVPRIINLHPGIVHPDNLTADQSKGKEIPTFTASHFQDTSSLGNENESSDIIDVPGS